MWMVKKRRMKTHAVSNNKLKEKGGGGGGECVK